MQVEHNGRSYNAPVQHVAADTPDIHRYHTIPYHTLPMPHILVRIPTLHPNLVYKACDPHLACACKAQG